MKGLPYLTAAVLLFALLLVSHCSRPAHFSVAPCPDASGIKSKWDLWRFGTCLRGANIWQKVIDPLTDGDTFGDGYLGPPYTPENLTQVANLGANFLNFSVPGIFTERPPYVADSGVVNGLSALIARAQEANLFVVISFRTGPGRNEASFSPGNQAALSSVWTDSAAQDAWVQMWRQAATDFVGEPNIVGYNLMVEPNANQIFFNMWDPQEFYPRYSGSSYDWNVLAGRIARAIREVDTQTPILIGGMDSSDPLWLSALQTSGVGKTVYALHQYGPTKYTGLPQPSAQFAYPGHFDPNGGGDPQDINSNWLDNILQPVNDFRDARQVPVAVNEFGVMRWEYGAAPFLRDEMNAFEAFGVNHAIWIWESSWPKLGYDQFNFRHGPDPGNNTDVPENDLTQVIRENWARNRIFYTQVKDHF